MRSGRLMTWARKQTWISAAAIAATISATRVATAQDAQRESPQAAEDQPETLPLAPARTIEFDTDEGTWISVDVSPDGRMLVFDLLGDLYTLPISGGDATRITSGMAFDSQPRFSPDGRRIVFVSDRSGAENLWLAGTDGGEPTKLTDEKERGFISPVWTTDGRSIIVTKRADIYFGTRELWLYDLNGGKGVKLATGEGRENLNLQGPALTPDGRYIYAAQKRGALGGLEYNTLLPLWQIVRIDRQTGEIAEETAAPGSGLRPVLSPDGRWLVYATRHDSETGLRVRDLTTGSEQWLVYPVQRDDQEASSFTRDLMPAAAFTPDSRALITSFDGKIQRVEIPSGEVTTIPFRARVEQELGPALSFSWRVEEGPVRAQQIRGPRLSPDGRRVVFTALDRLWIKDLPDGEPRRLTSQDVGEYDPTWSPDGQDVVFVTWSDRDGGHVWRVRPDQAGEPTRLTTSAALYAMPTYSPDGRRIVLVRGLPHFRGIDADDPSTELHWLPAEGGPTTRITGLSRATMPHFAQEPDRVYFYDREEGLSSVGFDGTDRRAHVKVTGFSFPSSTQRWGVDQLLMGPDGEHVLIFDGQLYIARVPLTGGEPLTLSTKSLASAPVPMKQLTTLGAEFPSWTADGRAMTYSLGRTFVRIDLGIDDDWWQTEAKDSTAWARQLDGTEIIVEAPRPRPSGAIVFRGARVLTMRRDPEHPDLREILEAADVVVRDNRIAAVGPQGTVPVPADAEVIDASGKTIVPGFVDIHAHLDLPRRIHRREIWSYLANLAYGVTTTRDPQTHTTDVLAIGDLVETGQIVGPRIYSTGPGIGWTHDIKSSEQAMDVLTQYRDHFGTNTIKEYVAGDRQVRQWIIMAAEELGLMPTTEGGNDMKLDLTQIADGYPGQEHSFPLVPLYKDVVEFTARAGITYTPTLLVVYGGPAGEHFFYAEEDVHGDAKLRRFVPHFEIDKLTRRRERAYHPDESIVEQAARDAAKIAVAGGRIGLGGHGQLQGLGVHWEIWALASGGMPAYEVLRAATLNGAEAIGLGADLGSIEPGKLADLLVLDENPLEDIRHTNTIRYVVKNGVVRDGDTLDQVWPENQPLPPPYWLDQDPVHRLHNRSSTEVPPQ